LGPWATANYCRAGIKSLRGTRGLQKIIHLMTHSFNACLKTVSWRNLNNSDTRQSSGVWAVFSLTSLKQLHTLMSHLCNKNPIIPLKNKSFVNTLSNSPPVLDRIKFLFCLVRSRPEMYLCLIIFYQAWLGSTILPASFTHSPATHGGEAMFVLYIGTIGTRPI
jgi:hypothetical protein